jgi:hypothetical protein
MREPSPVGMCQGFKWAYLNQWNLLSFRNLNHSEDSPSGDSCLRQNTLDMWLMAFMKQLKDLIEGAAYCFRTLSYEMQRCLWIMLLSHVVNSGRCERR